MEEKLNRINEIRAEAKEIAEGDLPAAEKLEKLNALSAERTSLEEEIAVFNATQALEAEAPEVVEPKAEEADEADDADEAEGDAPAEEPAPEEAPAEDDPEDAAEAPAAVVEPEAIAAAVNSANPTNEVRESEVRKGLTIVASTNAGGLSVGGDLKAEDFGAIHRMAAKAGEGTYQKFATIRRFDDDNKAVSSRSSAIENSLNMYTKREYDIQPLTAAACFCGPFETKKDIETIGLDARPVQGLFRTVPVTGPFEYIRELSLGDVSAGVNQWTCADQASVVEGTLATYKPCVDLTCQAPVQVDPYAVVACGKVATYQQLSHPELVDDFIAKLGIQYARTAEQLLLDEIRATSTELTYAPAAGHGLLWQLEKVLAHLAGLSSYGQRINWSDYALILPPGLIEVLIVDEHLRGFSRGANREAIIAQLRALGVGQIVESLDVDSTAEATYTAAIGTYVSPGNTVAFDQCTAIGDWTVYVVPVSSYTVGLSTMVEAGFTRDSSLIRQNLVQYFEEGLEFIEKVNDVPSYTLTLTGAGNGVASALAEVPSCVVIP